MKPSIDRRHGHSKITQRPEALWRPGVACSRPAICGTHAIRVLVCGPIRMVRTCVRREPFPMRGFGVKRILQISIDSNRYLIG